MRRTFAMAAILVIGICGVAQAQPDRPRVRLLFDGGAHVTPGAFGQTFTVTKNLEDTPVSTDLKVGGASFFDVGARIRIAGRLSVGGVGFRASGTADGTVNAKVPHPLYFNQPRDVSGDLSGLRRQETGAHIELAYLVAASRRMDVMLFGGPTWVSAQQQLVTDISYTDSYPFDVATFTAAQTATVKASATGFNVGGDVTWRLGDRFGIAGLVRYSRATVTLSPANGNTVDVKAGGIQAGAGLRIIF